MKQVTTRQHYLPRYRLQHFLRSNNKYYVYSNGTNPNKRDRETGKNDSSFALCDKLYELTEVPSWTKHENLIETGLLANDVEPEDAGEIKKVINNIKANTKLSLSDSEWLGKYALRMLYRSPAYMKKIKSLPQFNDPMTYYAFMPRRDKEREELLAIRNGKYLREDGSYAPEFFELVDALEKRFQYDVKKTALPAKPDCGKIEELLVEINKSYLRRVI